MSKTTPADSKTTVSLEDAQANSQKQMASQSASLDEIKSFLTRKANKGKYFSPAQIATGLGEGISDKSVRKSLQKAGLAKGKAAVIAADEKIWLGLGKSGNRNGYCAFDANNNAPTFQ